MFIDRAKVYVKAGSGGKGCQCIYRDKYNRRGIPDGGDGGKGGDIIVKADKNLFTLLDFKYNRHFYAQCGKHGSGKHKKGKAAPSIVIKVPCGTSVIDLRQDCLLADLIRDGEEVKVASGGRGGQGNRHHIQATEGQPGEERELLFDLKLIADVGVVGFPNAGKSTLVSSISNAHPAIAAYPFTTKSPALGVVKNGMDGFVVADIPGLIEGSAKGRGLGDRFLRHVERTRLIVHLVDMSGSENRNPVDDYKIINQELKQYGSRIYKKPQILAANKMDLEPAAANLKKFRRAVKKKIYPVSALEKQGLEDLIEAVSRKLQKDSCKDRQQPFLQPSERL